MTARFCSRFLRQGHTSVTMASLASKGHAKLSSGVDSLQHIKPVCNRQTRQANGRDLASAS